MSLDAIKERYRKDKNFIGAALRRDLGWLIARVEFLEAKAFEIGQYFEDGSPESEKSSNDKLESILDLSIEIENWEPPSEKI